MTERDGGPRSYSEWTEALGQRFFREENAGLPITYFVDDDTLAEIVGPGAVGGAARLGAAVRGQLVLAEDENPFTVIERRSDDWQRKGSAGFPPSLPVLAVAVLAATRMAASGAIQANAYYQRFWPILNIDESPARRRGYGLTVPWLWKQLDRWLDSQQGGRLGRSTIAEHPWWTLIGYALSQALFRTSDRHKLYRFLSWFGLKPGAEINPRELLAYYRLWVRDSPLSAGAKRMAEDAAYEAQLVSLLQNMASVWDGTPRDVAGRREAAAHVVLDFSEHPRGALWVLVERPPGAPATTEVRGATATTQLESSRPGWYDKTYLPLTRDFLEGGFRATGDELAVHSPEDPVHVLSEDEDLGCMISVPRAQLFVEHFVLVRQDWRMAVDSHLKRFAAAGWEDHKPEGLPGGWVARRRVTFPSVPVTSVPPELQCLVPRPQQRPSLWGGLPMAGRATYLRGGEPDLIVPTGLREIIPQVAVDQRAFQVGFDGLRLPLKELDLPPGQHEVVAGPTVLRFETLETIGVPRAAGCGSVVRRLPCPDNGGEHHDASFVEVCGPLLRESGDCRFARPLAPLIVPRGRVQYRLIGACPGELEEVREPASPSWVRRVPLFLRSFEVSPTFPVAWVLIRDSRGLWAAHLRTPIAPSDEPRSGCSEEEADAWSRAVLGQPVQVLEQDRLLWDAYTASARSWQLSPR